MKEERAMNTKENRIKILQTHFGECFDKDGHLDTQKLLGVLQGLGHDFLGGGGYNT